MVNLNRLRRSVFVQKVLYFFASIAHQVDNQE